MFSICRWLLDAGLVTSMTNITRRLLLSASKPSRNCSAGKIPLGKEINIEGRLFQVIGTVQKIKSVFGGGKDPNDNRVILPLKTFQNSASGDEATRYQRQGHVARRHAQGDGRDSRIAAATAAKLRSTSPTISQS